MGESCEQGKGEGNWSSFPAMLMDSEGETRCRGNGAAEKEQSGDGRLEGQVQRF